MNGQIRHTYCISIAGGHTSFVEAAHSSHEEGGAVSAAELQLRRLGSYLDQRELEVDG